MALILKRVFMSAISLSVSIGFAATPLATNAEGPVRRLGFPARRVDPAPVRTAPMRRRRDDTPTDCTAETGNGQFDGGGSENIAGNYYSGVLVGVDNYACGEASGIASGGISAQINGTGHVPGGVNETDAYDSFIGTGDLNWIPEEGAGSFIGGGGYQRADEYNPSTYSNIAAGYDSFVGAGDMNQIASGGNGSFIGAGGYAYASRGTSPPTTAGNQISASDSFIGAGDNNSVGGQESVIGGGQSNDIATGASESVIAGGVANVVSAQKGAVGGGEANEAEGSFTTVPGGYHNIASGNESFAAGSQAQAQHVGSFVWSDYVSGETPLTDSGNGEFVARASGGVYFFSNAAKSVGVHLAAGAGAWSSLSDRNAKDVIAPLDDAAVLAKVAALPVSTWQYKTESGVRHVGPMAQDFYAAFGVGEDDRHITSIDEDGIALAAIKAVNAKLNAENRVKDAELVSQRAEITALRDEMRSKDGALERRLAALEVRSQLSH